MRIVVVFPQPDGPRSETISPAKHLQRHIIDGMDGAIREGAGDVHQLDNRYGSAHASTCSLGLRRDRRGRSYAGPRPSEISSPLRCSA